MFELSKLVFLNFIFLIVIVQICQSEPAQQHLSLYSPDASVAEAEYTEVLVKRVGDNLTLVCEIKGDQTQRLFVWNYVAVNGSSTHRPFSIEPVGPTSSSMLLKPELQIDDSGQYLCSSPPHSVTKFVLVQEPPSGTVNCARGAFSCGARCVLPTYVCDGRADCARAEDEAPPLCPPAVCQRPAMLNCSSGRCISAAACCPGAAGPLCLQHSCCLEHMVYRTDGFIDVEFPASFEDKHAPDQYGFIQSTIYTVTACALIFMIAAVLLVSAICKMHMKRAALRSYARAAAQRHYTHQPTPRYPPCYEASRLLEQEAGRTPVPTAEAPMQTTPDPQPEDGADAAAGFGSRLSNMFSSRYRQVPTECEVEMTAVRPSSLQASPRARLPRYRSPTYCDLDSEYYLSADTGNCGRELNYMSPVDVVGGRLELDRRLTLQLGRFQLSLPRLRREPERPPAPAPGLPDLHIADLDCVLHTDTYTLNGRTIRLLGGDFSAYPRPPPYSLRKAGPPPAYGARAAADPRAAADAAADTNVEMPPRYEDVNSNDEHIERVSVTLNAIRESGESLNSTDHVHIDNTTLPSTNNFRSADNIAHVPAVDNIAHDLPAVDNMNSIHILSSESIPAIDDVNANEIVGD